MKALALLTAGALALCASASWAQTSPPSSSSGTKLSQSECSGLWQQANPSNASKLTEAQVAPYITNFKAANPDGDTTIEHDEWVAACNKGLVKSSSSSGASSGESGSAKNPTEHAPTNRVDEVVPKMLPPSKQQY
jgi:hypothetical protein